jgi:2'-5' RNA ligase
MQPVPRRRFGVALLIPAPIDREIEGLRRACGDGALGKIPPHITLVPPVNVRQDAVGEALGVLRAAAATAAPLVLQLGPARTFLPSTPVLYLEIGGDLDGMHRLRNAVFAAPLARSLTWPFVPHVTLAEEQTPERLEAAVAGLADYQVEVRIDRIHLLEEHKDPVRGRVWEPAADAPLAPAVVVGRGGLPLELVTSERVDPEAAALLDERSVVVTARREGRVVGVARALLADDGHAHLQTLTVSEGDRRTGVGTQLLAALEAALAARGAARVTSDDEAIGAFLRGRGWTADRSMVLVRTIFANSG